MGSVSHVVLGLLIACQLSQTSCSDLPDVTDASASQPSVSYASSGSSTPAKSQIGAIIGGVMAGTVLLITIASMLWLYHRRRRRGSGAERRRVDLMANNSGIEEPKGNPLVSHLHRRSWNERDLQVHPFLYAPEVQQPLFTGYPVSPPTSPQGPGPAPSVPGIVYTKRTSKDSLPTVTEQLDEKKRLRAARQNSNEMPRVSIALEATDRDSIELGSNTVALSHAHSHFYTRVIDRPLQLGHVELGVGPEPILRASTVRVSEKTERQRSRDASTAMGILHGPRSRRVMNPGSVPPSESAPSEVADLGDNEPAPPMAGESVPGARLSTARDRAIPPPSYSQLRQRSL